jgi:hypothetical protein
MPSDSKVWLITGSSRGLGRALAEAVSSAGFSLPGQEPFDSTRRGGDASFRDTSEDIHRALFEKEPEARTLDELQAGLRQYVQGRRARR